MPRHRELGGQEGGRPISAPDAANRRDVPSLRIVEDLLWQAAKARQSDVERRHERVRDGVRKGRDVRSSGLAVAASHFHRLLRCGQCGGDFCHIGRDRYGCAEHYRRKGCSNGKTVRRRMMDAAVRDVLAETAALITRHEGSLIDIEQVNVSEQQRQMERDRVQLAQINRRLQGLMSAIEDGLYTATLKVRFQQLEDQVQRLRAKLRVSGNALVSLQEQADSRWAQLQELIAKLQSSDLEYDVLQFRRIVGTINVIPEASRSVFRFSPAWWPSAKAGNNNSAVMTA